MRTKGTSGANQLIRSTVEAGAQAESLEDEPFTLNQRLPVPPHLEATYQRKAPIVVELFQQGQDPSSSRSRTPTTPRGSRWTRW